MKLFVQSLVSLRCKMILLAELEKMGLKYTILELGESNIKELGAARKYHLINTVLRKYAIVGKNEKRSMLIDQVKAEVAEIVNSTDETIHIKLSVHLSTKLNCSYPYLSSLFSHVHGCTLEHFIIAQRIERVKGLMKNRDSTLTEIAWRMHYSSVAHLSAQFKKVMGVTPSLYQSLEGRR